MKTIKLTDILSISGKSGLFMYVAQARNGMVVESIDDKRRHVAPATARVSSLKDIAIFTENEEVPLADVLYTMHEKNQGKEALSHKAPPEELESYFREIVPEYDPERVYVSDIRKVIQWYNQLHQHEMLEVIDKEETADDKEETADKKEEAADAGDAGRGTPPEDGTK